MAKLQAGIVDEFQTDTLAGEMDGEFVSLWNSLNDIKLPEDPNIVRDRRVMFVAIARGMLRYLHNHLNDIGTTTDTAGGIAGSEHDHQLEFEWEN